MKQFRSTIILLVVAILIGGYVYYRERGPAATVGETVLMRTSGNANSVKITQSGKSISLRQKGDSWQVQQGKQTVPANPDSIKSMLKDLRLIESGSVVTKPEKLTAYGLKNPAGSVQLEGNSITFGDSPSFDKSKVYAQIKTGKSTFIALLNNSLKSETLKTFAQWRDKSALRFIKKDVTRVQLKTPKATAVFEAKKEDKTTTWKISQPLQAKANSDAVRSLLDTLSGAQISDFLADNPKDLSKWGLKKPTAKITLITKKGTKSLIIGKKLSDGYAAQNSYSKVVFALPKSTFEAINKPLSNWREKTVLALTTGDVTMMDISARGKSVTLTKSGDKWTASNPKLKSTIVKNSATDFLVGLQNLEATNFIDHPKDDATYGLDKPALTVRVTSTQWNIPKTVTLSTHDGKNYATVSGKHNTVYVMPSHVFAAFSVALDKLLGKAK